MKGIPGLLRVDGVVVLAGPALRAALECALIAVKHRRLSGLPYQRYEGLAEQLHAAMSAASQLDVEEPAVRDTIPMHQPTVPIANAAVRLGKSVRQATRLAPRLGGQLIGGRWFVDEIALHEHVEGRS